mmetsp:Transcript_42386/g.76960  ORF Transcript_42386/g.76960 Transcript_42386/m.76960 type:complete len:96 (-) Transcript_42386:197-484(-)
MDRVASTLRGCVVSGRSSYRAARRWALERIYVCKEIFFSNYDAALLALTCRRRHQRSSQRYLAAFARRSPGTTPDMQPYDFTMLQHGISSRMSTD